MYKSTKLQTLKIQSDKYGTWLFEGEAIGGKPCPSEAEAHVFRTEVVPLIEKEITRILNEVFFKK